MSTSDNVIKEIREIRSDLAIIRENTRKLLKDEAALRNEKRAMLPQLKKCRELFTALEAMMENGGQVNNDSIVSPGIRLKRAVSRFREDCVEALSAVEDEKEP